MRRLTEGDSLKFKNLSAEEKAQRGILGRLYGPVASFANPTRNGRKYSQELWEQVFNSDLIKERFANGGIFGELCHPADREEVEMEKVAVVMPEPPVKDNKGNLIAYVDIIDTPCGRIAYQLAKYGYKFGISTRGTGDIIEGIDGDEVDPETYQLNALDLVEIPAVESARLTFTESLDKKRYNKTLRQTLKEELNKASAEDKVLMEDALNDMGISLDSEVNKVDSDKYPYLADAIKADAVQIEDGKDKITNKKFDTQALEDNDIDVGAVKDDLQRYAEHRGKDFEFNNDCAEDLQEGLELKDLKESSNRSLVKQYRGCNILFHDGMFVVLNPYGTKIGEDKTLVRCHDIINDYLDTGKVEESFDPAGVTSVFEVINDGIETDEDPDSLAHYLSQIISYCKGIADDYDLQLEEDPYVNESEELGSDKEVVDDKSEDDSEIIAELQEALKRVKRLEADKLSLQEKLSVGNAKETELKEQLQKYKQATVRLSGYGAKVKELQKQLSESKKKSAENKQITEKLSKSELSAKMRLSETEDSLNKYKEENKKLTENVNSLTAKLTKSQDLVSRYKKSYAALKESYLETKAKNYGVKPEDLKQKLGESYKIKDIDRMCEELSKVKTNMGKLPFRITESTKIGVKGSTEYINGRNSVNDDDFISDSLRSMLD